MDATGSGKLRTRIEQQEHWCQALAVQQGLQPKTDPDGFDLEEIREDLRLYSVREQQRQLIAGRPELVTRRLTKQLVDGWWQTRYETEKTELLVDEH